MNRYRVRITLKAEADVDAVLAWFHEQAAPLPGAKWFDQIMAGIQTLETMPERGRLAAEAADIGLDIREIPIGNRRGAYRIIFLIQRRTVYILRVWHSARDAIKRDDL